MKVQVLAFCLCLLLVGTASAADSLNFRLIGFYRTAARACDVVVDSGYACVTDINGSLRVISISDPAHPYEVGHYDTTCSYRHPAIVSGSYVYLADAGFGVHVISIADPAHPAEVGFLNTPATIGGIAVACQYAYMAAGTELLVVSVADPANPAIVARCDTLGTGVSDVAVSGNYAYVADYTQGLQVISVADPLHPVEVGHYDTTDMMCVAVSGSYVCAGSYQDWLRVISVADPAHPTEVGFLAGIPVNSVTMDGNIAYVAEGPSGPNAVSIADPAHPLPVGYYYISHLNATGLTLAGAYIFVADFNIGLMVFQYYQSGVEELAMPHVPSRTLAATVVRNLPAGAVAFDAMGRRVMSPRAGVYFLRDDGRGARGAGGTRIVVVQR
jgi:hypothetical protein